MEIKLVIENKRFDEERALYNLKDATVFSCTFAGEADGESALKECRRVTVKDCKFSLRYPLWHAQKYDIFDCEMDEGVRAPIWYSLRGNIRNSTIKGIKCLRECDQTNIVDCDIVSDEFGWRCRDVTLTGGSITSTYLLFEASNVNMENFSMKGKYSFQYTENVSISDAYLDTKDAFWHSKNVRVENSTLKGEYLGWFSENLTLVNCRIIGTQPLCYCTGLKLVNCIMEETDLSFEYSEVEADIIGHIVSVKNPKSGYIRADSIGEIISDDSIMENSCRIICGK